MSLPPPYEVPKERLGTPKVLPRTDECEIMDGPHEGTILRLPNWVIEFRAVDDPDKIDVRSRTYHRQYGKTPEGRRTFRSELV